MEFVVLALLIGLLILIQNRLYRTRGMEKLDYECRLNVGEARQGDEIELVEVLSNRKWLPMPWLKTEITSSRWLDFAGSQSVVTGETRYVPSFFMLKGHHKVVRKWRVKCLKRGVFSIDKVVVVSTDLLGNVSLSSPVEVDASVTVLPAPLELEELFLAANRLCGDLIVRRRYIPDPFYLSGVREYTNRDPLNRVHWPATAREQRLMVRNNDDTTSQSLLLLLNAQTSYPRNFTTVDKELMERSIRVCATYLEQTLESGIPVRLMSNSSAGAGEGPVVSTESWGREHVLDLERILARLRLNVTEPFHSFLEGHCRMMSSTDIVLITSYLSDEIFEFARDKQAQGVHVKLLAVCNLEEVLDLPGDCEIFCLREEDFRLASEAV